MKNSKLLFLTSSYPFGHGESFISPEINFLSNYYNLDVLPTYPRGSLRTDFSNNLIDIPLFSLTLLFSTVKFIIKRTKVFLKLVKICIVNGWLKSLKNLVLIPKSIYIFEEIIKNNEYAFIYCHWLSAPAQLALLLNTLSGIKYGVSAHRWDIVDCNNFYKKIDAAKFIRIISEGSIKLFCDDVIRKYGHKIHIIYMGVDVPFDAVIDRDFSKIKCLTVASLINVKGHEYLIDALKIIKDKGIECELLLVGSGELREELEAQVNSKSLKENVCFLGQMNSDELTNLYLNPKINVFCLPSVDLGNGLHEGIPVALMEAMSFGIPCISTRTGSISELILDGYCGLLVNDKSADELADSIIELYSNKVKSREFAILSRNRINNCFSSSVNNKKLVELISC